MDFNPFQQVQTNFATPTIDQSGVNTQLGTAAQNEGQEQTALNEQAQMAAGKGPSAATNLLQNQTQQTEANTNALAAGGGALARRQAMMQGASATQALGGQAATARAQEQIGAMGAQGQLAGTMAGQNLQAAGLEGGIATNQANLGMQTNSLNASQQVANMQAAGANMASGETFASGLASGAMKALAADADIGKAGMDFMEPGGDAEWTIREEDNFLLLVNRRNGKMFKMGMQPLSPQEHQQAMAKHGAGPINAPAGQGRVAKQMADGDMGGGRPQQPQGGGGDQFAEMVRRAHPMLYKAAAGGGTKQFADADTGSNPNSEDNWAVANQMAGEASDMAPPRGGLTAQPTGGYEQGWDDTIHANGGSAPGDPDAPSEKQKSKNQVADDNGPTPSQTFQSMLGSLQAGNARPQATPLQDPSKMYGDGDIGNDMGMGLDKAIAAADARVQARKAAAQAPGLLAQLHGEKMGILRDLDRYSPENAGDNQSLLKRRPGMDRGINTLYPNPDSVRGLDVLSREGEYPTALGRGMATDMTAEESNAGDVAVRADREKQARWDTPRYQDGDLGGDSELAKLMATKKNALASQDAATPNLRRAQAEMGPRRTWGADPDEPTVSPRPAQARRRPTPSEQPEPVQVTADPSFVRQEAAPGYGNFKDMAPDELAKYTAPRTYPDGELGSEDNPADADDPNQGGMIYRGGPPRIRAASAARATVEGDEDPFEARSSALSRDRKRTLYGKGTADVDADDARASFDQDIARTGREGSRWNPAEGEETDPLKRGLDEAMSAGAAALAMVRSRGARRGSPENPVDLDEEDETWSPRTPEMTARPMLAALVSARPPKDYGPTDFVSATEGTRRPIKPTMPKKEPALDLVPGEARELDAQDRDTAVAEAERRTKSRRAVRALMQHWASEKKVQATSAPRSLYDEGEELVSAKPPPAKRKPYADADIGYGSALSKMKFGKPKKTRAA